jgi:hypothetical protein
VTRLCWNAQEEIWRAARQEVTQVRGCPEGDHFCGVPVWKTPLGEQDRDI